MMKKQFTARNIVRDSRENGVAKYGNFTVKYNDKTGFYSIIFDGIVLRVVVGLSYMNAVEYLENKLTW